MYFPVLFLMLLSVCWVAIVIHELGHLLAGRLVGLKYVALQVPAIQILRRPDKLKFSFRNVMPFDGAATVQFDSFRRIHRRLRIFVAGGPLATAVGMLIGYFVLRSELLGSFASGWTACFVCVSLFLLVGNLIPFQAKSGMFTDGARLKMLLFPSDKTYRWLAKIGVNLQMKSKKKPRLWNKRWLAMATKLSDGSQDELWGTLYAYIAANDRREEALAATCLERCLSLSARISGQPFQNFLFLEASVFEAWFRNDTEMCLKWRSRVKDWKKFSWFLVHRADTALAWSQGEISKALSNCEEAIARADTLPAKVNREQFRESWKEWMEQIQERTGKMAEPIATASVGGHV